MASKGAQGAVSEATAQQAQQAQQAQHPQLETFRVSPRLEDRGNDMEIYDETIKRVFIT